jgi:hypothetical protein
MRKWLLIGMTCLFFACKQKTPEQSGNTPMKITDFYKAFNTLPLPIIINDSTLDQIKEGPAIEREQLSQIINTTALDSIVPGKNKKISFLPLFQITKDGNHYLILKLKQTLTSKIGIIIFDKENKFMDYKSIIEFANGNHERNNKSKSLFINSEPSFLINESKINNSNDPYNEKTAWAYSDGKLRVIFFDSDQKIKNMKIINPIDTLTTNNEFSGNYELNARNFITLRDNGAVNKYQFFLHTEKEEGECIGELKGRIVFNKNTATYSEKGDACHIQFNINGNSISFKEDGNCGNHRGIKCNFEESFNRKKKAKIKK